MTFSEKLRSIAFNILFYGSMVAFCIFTSPVLLFPRKYVLAFVHGYLAWVFVIERRVLGLHHKIIGIENLPPAPYIIVSKHQSAWETLHILQWFDDPVAIMKQELRRIPIWGWYAARMRMIDIDRSTPSRAWNSIVEGATRAKKEGRSIVIFPEGTRVKPGVAKPWRSGAFRLQQMLDLPLVPVALNSGLFWGRNDFWKHPGLITVEIMPPIPPGRDPAEVLAEVSQQVERASNRLSREAGGPETPIRTATPTKN
ncbi:MAG TPA: 1-acyl-sn-glycerol-3-phosphate acyltransferase [Rhodospirillaceae bacterium]|nr:MAG: hypothetical protein A2018_01865 [Alphaproteobacteria bacterium GWF2_58_20]HAU29605.1 1-acyl-sn-glycerol-3-phosphate acyltransferase [Rhodospirillaceae bacterium]